MKPFKSLLALCALIFFDFQSFGATNGVTAGASIQTVIDSSVAGDTLYLEPGLYTDPFTLNKPLTILVAAARDGGQAQFLGKVSVQNTGTNYFQQCFFGGNLETIGALVTVVDSQCNAPIFCKGGKLTLKRDILTGAAPLTLTNSAGLEALRLTTSAPIASFGTPSNPSQTLIVQSQLSHYVSLTTNKVWLGYNYFYYGGQQLAMAGCDAVLIGNKQYGSGSYLVTTSGGTLRMYNNLILNYSPISAGNGYGVSVSGTGVESINNTIVTYYTPFQVRDATAPINLRNTILKSNYAIDIGANSAALVFANSCLFVGGNSQSTVVAPFINCIINQDPLVLGDGTLQDGSPCINAGMAAAIYNNRDGTRNTIGYTGGPYLNPANYTNNAPMVFLLAGPQTILKGAVSSISVSAAASAGH